MLTNRELFFQHLALPSRAPLALEIVRAEDIYIYDANEKRYTDLVSGVSVSNLGHRHPAVIKAIEDQISKYMHLMVYGKYIQSPQVMLAQRLSEFLPKKLSSTYFVNSGSEAIEGAMKLAKRHTGKHEIIACKNAYHGGTQGALSILGHENLKRKFRPLLPGISFIGFNKKEDLAKITESTACVIIEPIQAEAGIIIPDVEYLNLLREKCDQTHTLLVFDEIQMGFGRTGKLFCFENFGVAPDILVLAKAMGGGMPIGAFISSQEIMSSLSENPELGHITTFGGHPVCCAAALANLDEITYQNLHKKANDKGDLFFNHLSGHPVVKSIRYKGLMMGVELESQKSVSALLDLFVKNGLIVDQFLFNTTSFRIAPPLIISEEQIHETCNTIIDCLDQL